MWCDVKSHVYLTGSGCEETLTLKYLSKHVSAADASNADCSLLAKASQQCSVHFTCFKRQRKWIPLFPYPLWPGAADTGEDQSELLLLRYSGGCYERQVVALSIPCSHAEMSLSNSALWFIGVWVHTYCYLLCKWSCCHVFKSPIQINK